MFFEKICDPLWLGRAKKSHVVAIGCGHFPEIVAPTAYSAPNLIVVEDCPQREPRMLYRIACKISHNVVRFAVTAVDFLERSLNQQVTYKS
jgi:hypothetical protein